ncbi:hypothetical protein FFF34_000195 [Inquilinus sp. KBS0705]|nr:hypothetical protein FFF34_000195 [Inquilinus sp. KBS0705]
MSSANNFYRFILLAIGLLVVVLGIVSFIQPAAIFPDPSWGFWVLRSMQMGAAFNTLISVNPENVATNVSEFLSWWSPGQYLVPYFFKALLGLNTGQATAVTTTVCQLTGLAGLYFFFKKAGFSSLIATLSLVVVICQQAFLTPYIFYNGGETLLFAFAGWFLYGCLVFDKPNLKLVLFVLLSGWIGFICKSSFIWMYAAGLLFIWLQLCKDQQGFGKWIIKGLWPGIPAVISVAVIYALYLSKGNNPSSDTAGLKLSWETFTFPLASPLLAGFSVDDVFHGLILNNDVPLLNYTGAIVVLVISAVLSILLMRAIYKKVPQKYGLLLVVFYGVSILFFGYAFLRQMAISFEGRHFRMIGLLVTPGAVYLFSQFKPTYRTIAVTAIMVIAVFTIRFYVKAMSVLRDDCAYGPSGIAQQFIDQPSLDYVTQLDKQNKKALFVFTSPDLGLEITHNRVINLEPLNDDISINFDSYVHKGFGGPIYILLPAKYIGIRASVILKCFPGYKGFTFKQLSDDYVLYYATLPR